MQSYEDVITHIVQNSCVLMTDGDYDEGSFFQNIVSFQMVYVPKEDILEEITCCDIFYELDIPPMEGMEESYAKFQAFRANLPVDRSK